MSRGFDRRALPTAVFAASLALITVLSGPHLSVASDGRGLDAVGYGAAVAAAFALLWWYRRPTVTALLVALALTVYVGRGYPNGPVLAAGWLGIFAVRVASSRRLAASAAVTVCGALTAGEFIARGEPTVLPLFFTGWSIASIFAAEVVLSRQQRLAAIAERAKMLEASREEETRRRIAEERLRIARDLHDSVAHGLAAIRAQSVAASRVLSDRPEAVRHALHVIEDASAQVLDELGAMLTVLRERSDAPELAPGPGLDNLPELVANCRAAGLAVELTTVGTVDDIRPAIGTAVYRVVQEGLTNALRHAPRSDTSVTFSAADHQVAVEVRTSGPASCAPARSRSTGVGLIGLRERVEATRGVFTAVGSDTGFVVRAQWPR